MIMDDQIGRNICTATYISPTVAITCYHCLIDKEGNFKKKITLFDDELAHKGKKIEIIVAYRNSEYKLVGEDYAFIITHPVEYFLQLKKTDTSFENGDFDDIRSIFFAYNLDNEIIKFDKDDLIFQDHEFQIGNDSIGYRNLTKLWRKEENEDIVKSRGGSGSPLIRGNQIVGIHTSEVINNDNNSVVDRVVGRIIKRAVLISASASKMSNLMIRKHPITTGYYHSEGKVIFADLITDDTLALFQAALKEKYQEMK